MSAAYFDNVQNALRKAGICEPVLIIDKARLDANIKVLKKPCRAAWPIALSPNRCLACRFWRIS